MILISLKFDSICPGPEPNGIQIPIGNNTGSLPDLTNLQFASPLPNPVDFDDTSLHTQNLYSTVSTYCLSVGLLQRKTQQTKMKDASALFYS